MDVMDDVPLKRVKCDDITFDKLPDEIIHDILKRLDLESLKVSSTVNQK